MAEWRRGGHGRARAGLSGMLGLLLLCLAACGEEKPAAQEGAPAAEPPVVMVAEVREEAVNPPYEFVGRVEAMRSVDLQARVEGFVQKRFFEEGQDVATGELLFVIDPAPYQARLASAEADLLRARATHQEAERQLKRSRALFERGVIARATLDTAIAEEASARAAVEAAEANVRTAELDLEYTRITAPFAGRIGRALVNTGALVGPSTGPLARIVQIDPIRVVFSISEAAFIRLSQQAQSAQRQLAETIVPEIRLPNGDIYPHQGKVDFLDNEVDPTTGTLAVRVTFPNPDAVLLPGQFVTVIIRREDSPILPIVPQAAVQLNREGAYVLVVDDRGQVAQRRITPGVRTEKGVAVEQGLKEGERVIVQGIQKVRPGMRVTVEPEAESTPQGAAEG